MARKREGEIGETPEILSSLLRRYKGRVQEPRLEMLYIMQDKPLYTIEQVAKQIGRSERTVRRWWKTYMQAGLDSLLADDYGQLPDSSPLPSGPGEKAPWIIPPQVRAFLNALPVTSNTIEWIQAMREELRKLLTDVDRVTINVNLHCDIHDPKTYEPGFFLTQHVATTGSRRRATMVTIQRRDKTPGALLLEELRRGKFPLYEYHPPCVFDYYINETAYVGTILLWRERIKPPIGLHTIATMTELQQFLIFLLSDCVSRRRHEEPDLQVFNDIVTVVSAEVGLSIREKEVFLHHLLGKSYDEIAGQLHITVDTVRKHVKAIHRKSGVRTYTELFARYFTPLREK